MSRVVIIGGGISGLACARLVANHAPNSKITLLEARERTGGNIQSRRIDGFLCETGPSGFLNRHPSTLALADSVGMGDEIISGCEQMRRRYILSGGRLRRFPDSPATFITTDLLSFRARARVLLEPAIPPGNLNDETVGQYARRRLGREAAELLVDPVISGIYAGDADRLSLKAVAPQLAKLDGGAQSLLMSLIQARAQIKTPSAAPSTVGRRRYVSFRNGLGQLTDALTASLGPIIEYESPAVAVRPNTHGWVVAVGGRNPREINADVVVSAAPAPAAMNYLDRLDPEISAVLSAVPYAPVAVVALGYREADIPHPLTGFGYLVPRREGGQVLGVLWNTSIFPGHRSGSGKTLLQAVLGGARNPNICQADDESLIRSARVQLKQAMDIGVPPIMAQVYRHPLGIPQYEVGHLRRVAYCESALLRHPGLFITGNALRGIGINACTADAEQISDAVASYVGALDSHSAAADTRVSSATSI
jgi:oxygen-dependent protoporphyrinogen oxidase